MNYRNQVFLLCGINDLSWSEKERPLFISIDESGDTVLSGKTRILIKIYERIYQNNKLHILNVMSFLSKEKEDLEKTFGISGYLK